MSSGSHNDSLRDCWTPNGKHCYHLRINPPECELGVDLVAFDPGSRGRQMALYAGEGCGDEDLIVELEMGVYWFNLTEPVSQGWYMKSWMYTS